METELDVTNYGLKDKFKLRVKNLALSLKRKIIPEPGSIITRIDAKEFQRRLEDADISAWLAVLIGEEVSTQTQGLERVGIQEDDYGQFMPYCYRHSLVDDEMIRCAELIGEYHGTDLEDPPDIAQTVSTFIQVQAERFIEGKGLAEKVLLEDRNFPDIYFQGRLRKSLRRVRVNGIRTREGRATLSAEALYPLVQYAIPASETNVLDIIQRVPELLAQGIIKDQGDLHRNILEAVRYYSTARQADLQGVLLVVDQKSPEFRIGYPMEGSDPDIVAYAFYRGEAIDREEVRKMPSKERDMVVGPENFKAVIRHTLTFRKLMIDLNSALSTHDVEEQKRIERAVVEYFIGAHEFDVEYLNATLTKEEKGRFGREVFLSFCSSYYEYEARGFLIEAQALINMADRGASLSWIKQQLHTLKDKVDFAINFNQHIDGRLREYMIAVGQNVFERIMPLNQRVRTVPT